MSLEVKCLVLAFEAKFLAMALALSLLGLIPCLLYSLPQFGGQCFDLCLFVCLLVQRQTLRLGFTHNIIMLSLVIYTPCVDEAYCYRFRNGNIDELCKNG